MCPAYPFRHSVKNDALDVSVAAHTAENGALEVSVVLLKGTHVCNLLIVKEFNNNAYCSCEILMRFP